MNGLQKLKSSTRLSRGAALVEYGMLVGLIAVLGIGAVLTLGGRVSETFDTASTTLAEQMAGEPTSCVGLANGESGAGGECATYNARSLSWYDTGVITTMNDQHYVSYTGSPNWRSGASNMAAMLASADSPEPAHICNDLNHGGYDDWVLPSDQEAIVVGMSMPSDAYEFGVAGFWTSSTIENGDGEQSAKAAYSSKANTVNTTGNSPMAVICVRALEG